MSTPETQQTVIIRNLGVQPYEPVWRAMQAFTDERDASTADEIWVLQHEPVFTQGQAGKPEHLLNPGDIPVVKSDRGGQVTYHGPGQLIIYMLINLRRYKLGVRGLVTLLEESLIKVLAGHGIEAAARSDAPGVYVDGFKIASLGLRIRKGCSFHGLSLNLDMDLEPFSRINVCGYQGLEVTQVKDQVGPVPHTQIADELLAQFKRELGYTSELRITGWE